MGSTVDYRLTQLYPPSEPGRSLGPSDNDMHMTVSTETTVDKTTKPGAPAPAATAQPITKTPDTSKVEPKKT